MANCDEDDFKQKWEYKDNQISTIFKKKQCWTGLFIGKRAKLVVKTCNKSKEQKFEYKDGQIWVVINNKNFVVYWNKAKKNYKSVSLETVPIVSTFGKVKVIYEEM